MDRFEAMSMLLDVLEMGSLSAASRARGVPVPTLSRKISDLEAMLGTKLLVRTTRKLTLTDPGIAYVVAARRILEEVGEAEREAAGEFRAPRGDLVLTAPVCFGRLHLLPIVADFLELFPKINIRLLLSDRNLHLIDNHVDMAVRIGKLPDSGMIATRVGSMRTVICASPSLLASQGMPGTPEDLKRLPCVTFDGPMPWPVWQARSPRSDGPTNIQVTPRLSVSTVEAAVDAAVRNVGLTCVLHYQVADALEAGALQIVLEEFEPEPAPIHLIHAARGRMPLKMRRFLDFAVPRLRQAVSRIEEATQTASP